LDPFNASFTQNRMKAFKSKDSAKRCSSNSYHAQRH